MLCRVQLRTLWPHALLLPCSGPHSGCFLSPTTWAAGAQGERHSQQWSRSQRPDF